MYKRVVYCDYARSCLKELVLSSSIKDKENFIDNLIASIDDIGNDPLLGKKFEKGTYKILIQDIYLVYYQIRAYNIIVLSLRDIS